jgi:CRP-like cAMP-binding protein
LRILLALDPGERERLLALTSPVSLESNQPLYRTGERIDTVYFPENAVVSLLTTVDARTSVEVANIGNEGIVGAPVFLGIENVGARECYQVEIPGQARAMDAEAFLEAAQRDPLRGFVQRFIQALFIQVAQRLACAALHPIAARYSRWLLLTHDRMGDREFPLTQESLAQMLGVRRASVTTAAGALQEAGFIRYSRGRVAILDREGLENAACECYRIIRSEFDRLLPLPGGPAEPPPRTRDRRSGSGDP